MVIRFSCFFEQWLNFVENQAAQWLPHLVGEDGQHVHVVRLGTWFDFLWVGLVMHQPSSRNSKDKVSKSAKVVAGILGSLLLWCWWKQVVSGVVGYAGTTNYLIVDGHMMDTTCMKCMNFKRESSTSGITNIFGHFWKQAFDHLIIPL